MNLPNVNRSKGGFGFGGPSTDVGNSIDELQTRTADGWGAAARRGYGAAASRRSGWAASSASAEAATIPALRGGIIRSRVPDAEIAVKAPLGQMARLEPE